MVPDSNGDKAKRRCGWVIPWFDGDRLAKVKIRQPKGTEPKYAEAFRDRPAIFPDPAAIRPAARWSSWKGSLTPSCSVKNSATWPPS